jgi:hypothetical protein
MIDLSEVIIFMIKSAANAKPAPTMALLSNNANCSKPFRNRPTAQ